LAQQFIESGDYFWNSGMFVFKARRYLTELGALAPDILAATQAAYEKAKTDLDFVRIEKAAFEACRSVSIDYAVMEKTRDALVLQEDVELDVLVAAIMALAPAMRPFVVDETRPVSVSRAR